jgi:adenylate kinase family enzyme
MRILITGASGSGTSTLGAALARAWDARFLDSDDYFWLPGDPPFVEKRPAQERLGKILADLQPCAQAVLAGCVMDWGDALENSFDLVVFLQVPTPVRLERLQQRELARYGRVNREFLAWAAQYDEGPQHCPVVRLEGELTQAAQFAALTDAGEAKVLAQVLLPVSFSASKA